MTLVPTLRVGTDWPEALRPLGAAERQYLGIPRGAWDAETDSVYFVYLGQANVARLRFAVTHSSFFGRPTHMQSLLVKTLVASCLIGLVTVGFAQNENKKKRGKGKNDPTAGLRKKLESAELGEELTAKVKKVLDEHGPKLQEAQAKVNAVLTAEQRKAQQEARKSATDAGRKRKAATEEGVAAMKLTDEQKTKWEAAEKEANAARVAMNKELSALLSDEQKEKLGLGDRGGKKNKNRKNKKNS
ncbi:MAG: hypothetical protein WD872_05605 [Pirellulaceae bacterium]